MNNALNILVNQCYNPGIYNECFCLGCSKDLRSSFANNVNINDNVNDNVNDKDNDNDNDNDKDKDSVNDNDNVNDNGNDNVSENFRYLFGEKHQWGKPNNKEYQQTDSVYGKPSGFTDLRSSYTHQRSGNFVIDLSNNISVNINEDLQSRLNDDNIITEATLPENFRCIISGPSECGKTLLLKKLILARIYFDKLYIIGPTGDQYEGVERIN